MLKLTTLYSGSSGNCTLIQSKEANILVDAGFSQPRLSAYLNQMGLTLSDIHLILISHDHCDHTSALAGVLGVCELPVATHEKLCKSFSGSFGVNCFLPLKSKFCFRDIEIDITTLSHDVECCGFRFFDGKDFVATVTDTGKLSEENIKFLSVCKTVLLESNHDLLMLKTGDYAYRLKARVMSDKGHLSNVQAAAAFKQLLSFGKLQNLILGHLSQNNNTHEHAFLEAQNVLQQQNLVEGRDVNIFVADQNLKGKTIC